MLMTLVSLVNYSHIDADNLDDKDCDVMIMMRMTDMMMMMTQMILLDWDDDVDDWDDDGYWYDVDDIDGVSEAGLSERQ